jgi:hypothetical protein
VTLRVLVVSDIHYASPAEQLRRDYESAAIRSWAGRRLLRAYRRYIWLKDPFAHNGLLHRFVDQAGDADLVVGNGDFSCDSAFVGVHDDAAAQSARLCLELLRARYGSQFAAVMGDHELGKRSLAGGRGGPRFASWQRATDELGIQPLWHRDLGSWMAVGLTSTLLALPVFLPEIPETERPQWLALRQAYTRQVENLLEAVPRGHKLLIFLHDPTALPFLAKLPAMQARLPDVDATVIGHLHSPVILWMSRRLAGLPPVRFCGNAVRRMSEALNRARAWTPFGVHLCPSLAGLELFNDGGYLELEDGEAPGGQLRVRRHRMAR